MLWCHTDLQNLWDVAIQHFAQVNVIMQEAATLPRTLLTFNLKRSHFYQYFRHNAWFSSRGMLKQGHGQIFNMEGWGRNGVLVWLPTLQLKER